MFFFGEIIGSLIVVHGANLPHRLLRRPQHSRALLQQAFGQFLDFLYQIVLGDHPIDNANTFRLVTIEGLPGAAVI